MTVAEFINKVGFKVKNEDVNKVNDTISGIKNTATKLLGAIGIGLSLSSINALIEEFDAVNDGIRNSISGLEDVNEVQHNILDAANAAKTSYSEMASTVSNLAKSNSDLFPVQDAIDFSTNVTKLMKTAGRSESEISSIMEGMNKSFQKGIVDTETLNKMLEQAPETANILAEHLGVAKSELLQMASDGKMSVNDLKEAFLEAGDEIDEKFSQLNFGVSDAIQNIRNKWGFWLKETDEMLGLTQTIGKTMVAAFDRVMGALNRVRNGVVWLSDKLGGMQNLIKLVSIIAGTLLVAFGFDKIKSGLSAVSKLLSHISLKTLAIIAVVVLLALLVEDFINFMQGNDSLIGTLLEKAGVDVDKFRENIIKIWENIKTVLSAIWQGIKNVAIPIFQGIWEVIKSVFEAIGGIIEKIAPQFAEFIDELANGKIDTEKWVKVGETIAKIGVAIVGVVAAVKTVITVVKAVTTVVKGVSAAISFLTSPVGIVIAVIAALIAIGIALYKNWDKIKAFAISIWTAIKDFFSNTFNSIKEFFVNIWESISSFFSGIWEGIKSTVSGAVSAVWNTISSIFTAIWNFISGIASSIWETISTAFTNVWTTISEIASNIWNTISETFSSIWTSISETVNNIWTTITTVFTNIWNSIVETVTGIKDSIVEGFTAAIDWIKSLPEQAFQWGADIISGIINGIKSMVGAIGDAVSGVASKIKGFLGFSEPEEGPLSDFHTYMPDMIDLMAKGIEAGKSKVRDALGDLTGDMSVMANANVVSSGTAAVASGGSQVSKSVVQNVNINNKFEGDKAIQQKAAGAMDKSARDVTSELARGLAYAR